MKNLIIMAVVVVVTLGLASSSFAATYRRGVSGASEATIQGTVVSLNQHNKTIVVKDKDDGKDYVVALWAADFASVNQGQNVQVTLEQGSNLVRNIR